MIDFLASEEQYADHLFPLYAALPPHLKGTWYGKGRLPRHIPSTHVVVASYIDLKVSRFHMPHATRVLVQHGAGQSYFGTDHGARHPSYSGGVDHHDVTLFLCPNEFSASKWRDTYPKARVEVVGSPHVDALPPRSGDPLPTVAVSFHWQCGMVEESKTAFPQFRGAYALLKTKYNVVAHAHPRARRMVKPYAARAKVPFLETFREVCEQADVYVCDNSSTIFEFAATGRPVVLLNSTHYRRNVNHGMRFWELATIGPNANAVQDVVGAVELALLDPVGLRQERERVVDLVYPIRQGAAAFGARVLEDWHG